MGAKATGRCERRFDHVDVLVDVAFQMAFNEAVENFEQEHGREPDWDVVYIRGGSSTVNVVVEIEEVEA